MNIPSLIAIGAFALCYGSVAVTRGVPTWASLLYLGASLLCFAFYAVDKAAAIHGRQRISESMLLSLGLVGGWPGAIVAQQALRHKSSKMRFRVRFWITVTINVAAFVWIALFAHAFELSR